MNVPYYLFLRRSSRSSSLRRGHHVALLLLIIIITVSEAAPPSLGVSSSSSREDYNNDSNDNRQRRVSASSCTKSGTCVCLNRCNQFLINCKKKNLKRCNDKKSSKKKRKCLSRRCTSIAARCKNECENSNGNIQLLKNSNNNMKTKASGKKMTDGGGRPSKPKPRPQGNKTSSSSSWVLHRLDKSRYPMAKCLDGTQGVYYTRRGRSHSKVLITLEGGGWCSTVGGSSQGKSSGKSPSSCNNNNKRKLTTPTTNEYSNCHKRALTKLGSTKYDSARSAANKNNGWFSTSKQTNPAFWDWSHVHIRYCDGASFSGRRKDKIHGLYSRGNYILVSILKDLKKQSSGGLLRNPTHVVVAGSSAGGLSALLHVHQFRTVLPSNKVKLAVISDAGFFSHKYKSKIAEEQKGGCQETSTPSFPEKMKKVYAISQPREGLPKACIKAQKKRHKKHKEGPLQLYNCMLASNIVPTIPVPVFVINSRYDSIQINGIKDSKTKMKEYGTSFKKEVTTSIQQQKNGSSGVYMTSCHLHHQYTKDIYTKRGGGGVGAGGVPLPPVNIAIKEWIDNAMYNRGSKNQNLFWISSEPYPCKGCCS